MTALPERLYVVEVSADREVRLVPIVATSAAEAKQRAERIIPYRLLGMEFAVRAARNGEWDSLHDALDDWYYDWCDHADGREDITDADFMEVVGWYHPTWCAIDAGSELQAAEERLHRV